MTTSAAREAYDEAVIAFNALNAAARAVDDAATPAELEVAAAAYATAMLRFQIKSNTARYMAGGEFEFEFIAEVAPPKGWDSAEA